MTIKSRIALSNILMVLVPLILIIAVSAVVYMSYNRLYGDVLSMSEIDYRKTLEAQQIIKNVSNQIEYSLTTAGIAVMQEDLVQNLASLGFETQLWHEGQVVFSNVTGENKSTLVNTLNHIDDISNFFVLQIDSTLLIYSKFSMKGEAYVMAGIKPNYTTLSYNAKSQVGIIYRYVVIVLVLSFLIILTTNYIITSRVGKNLIRPLDMLSYGAGQIKEGNLDYVIGYDETDEFGQVCSDFNEMRLRLKDSINTQMKYEEDRKELIAGVSHDLRTPLTAIKGYVKGIQDGVANTPEKQARYLDIAYSQACHMDMLVDKLFLFSKLDTGHFPFHFEVVDCNMYLQEFVNSFCDEFRNKGLVVDFENKAKKEVFVKLDKEEIRRVIINVLDNSAKYKNKDICEAKIILSSSNVVRIQLIDNGPGVEEKHVSHLFKSFYRGDESRTNSNQSSGLGLSIAERVIKAHGGTIKAENKEGFCITIDLPLAKEVLS